MAVTTCMDCKHWNPKATDTGMAKLGFARCDKKPAPGHTWSAHAQACGKFQEAEAKTAKARHAKWDVKKASAKQ